MERIALIITIFLVVSVLPLGIAGAVKADFYNDTSSNNITLTQYEHEAKSQPGVLMLLLDGQVSNPPQPPPAEPSPAPRIRFSGKILRMITFMKEDGLTVVQELLSGLLIQRA